jgi:AAA domain
MSQPRSGHNLASLVFSNQHFLQDTFGAEWERAHLCSFPGDPNSAGSTEWAGGPARRWITHCTPENNNYFAVSLFHSDGGQRVEARFDRLFVLGVDDVGPKIDPAKARQTLGEPSYRVETSSGNEQWLYVLQEPLTGVRRARELIHAVRLALTGEKAKDPGMEGVTRYLRLPIGMNTKNGARHRVRGHASGRRVSPAELEALFGALGVSWEEDEEDLGLTPTRQTKVQDVAAFDRDTVFQAFRVLDLVIAGPRNMEMGQGYDVHCPWEHEHTGRATTGAAYVPLLGRFKCHHGHCIDKSIVEVVPRLDEMLRDAGHGSLAALDFDVVTPGDVPIPAAGMPKAATSLSDPGGVAGALAVRDWIANGVLIRGAVTMVFGPPNQGKSLLLTMWTVALTLGAQWGGLKPAKPMKVLTLFAEEDNDEQRRRIMAGALELHATLTEIGSNLSRLVCEDVATMFHVDRGTRALVPTQAWHDLVRRVQVFRPDVVILDPLVELHSSEENDNTMLKAVVAKFRTLARKYQLAVVLTHHARKGEAETIAGSLDAARGASAIGGAARIAFTFVEMTAKEAISLGVQVERRRYYVRLDEARNTFSPPADSALWFEKISWSLSNGDSVGALRRWAPPAAGMSSVVTQQLASAIGRGCVIGGGSPLPWSPKRDGSERSVRRLFEQHGIVGGMQEDAAHKALLAEGITVQEFRHPGNRMVKKGLRDAQGLPDVLWSDGTT